MVEELSFDICRNRHGGNPESLSANADNSEHRDKQRSRVLDFIKKRGTEGATTDEVAVALSTTPNAVSGRLSELKRDHRIEKRGTRQTRTGSMAGVYVAFMLMLCAAQLSGQTVEAGKEKPIKLDQDLVIDIPNVIQVHGIRAALPLSESETPTYWRPMRNEEVIVTLQTLDGRKWVARWEQMK